MEKLNSSINETLNNMETSLKINKETSEKALMLLNKTKKIIELMEDVDFYYQEKILKDNIWKDNFDKLLSQEQIQMAFKFFEYVNMFLSELKNMK